VWDVGSKKCLFCFDHAGETVGKVAPDLLGVAFSPDGKYLATASETGTVWVWDYWEPTKKAFRLRGSEEDRIYAVAFSPDGKLLASASGDGRVILWDFEKCRQQASGRAPDDPLPQTEGGKYLNGRIDKRSKRPRAHLGRVHAVAFSRDGTRVATAGEDRIAKIWDISSPGRPHRLDVHDLTVYGVAFSREGKRLLTTSADTTARVSDIATERQLLTLIGHGTTIDAGTVYAAAVSPDGKRLASVSFNGTLCLYELDMDKVKASNYVEMAENRASRILPSGKARELTRREREKFLRTLP
jgi:WD40 repeat protein